MHDNLQREKRIRQHIIIRDSILTKISTVKFLSVTLDKDVTFTDHVNKVTTKKFKSLGVTRRLPCQSPADVMLKFYYSRTYSHVTYGERTAVISRFW